MKSPLVILLALFAGMLLASAFFIDVSTEGNKIEEAKIAKVNLPSPVSTSSPQVVPPPPPPTAKPKTPPAPVPKPQQTPAPTPPAPPPSAIPAVKSDYIYAKALKAALNIFCVDSGKGAYIMGSGAIIHPLGYVLTNGHIAEHFLDENTECTLRRGSPAMNFAKAKVIWLPSQSEKISGGEIPKNDIALLKIISMTDPDASVGGEFEYFRINPFASVEVGNSLYSLSYPTEFLGSETALKNANLVFSIGHVDKVVTIDENLYDAEGAYLKGELSAQHGSSGGIFLERERGEIVGLFVGLTEGATTADRKQFIFLASYIEQIVKNDKGLGIYSYLSSNP